MLAPNRCERTHAPSTLSQQYRCVIAVGERGERYRGVPPETPETKKRVHTGFLPVQYTFSTSRVYLLAPPHSPFWFVVVLVR